MARAESEPLKSTLATDAIIGAMTSPQVPGSGYVLLHHGTQPLPATTHQADIFDRPITLLIIINII
jgi:hypothetical protein